MINKGHFINGKWVKPQSDKVLPVINPATEEVLCSIGIASPGEVDNAVQAASSAFQSEWRNTSGVHRAKLLENIAAGIERELQSLAELEVLNNGKPLQEALWDIEDAAACFRYYANLARELDSKQDIPVALPDARFSSCVRREPVGVAALIIPWNFPMLMAAWKVAPAIAAGCCMVLKPSEVTPLTALRLADIALQAELPAGVLNVITGDGSVTGDALAHHPDVAKIAFTGSVSTGTRILKAGADRIANIALELGGKSPLIIFDDTDVEAAVEWIMFGIFWNQGEVCSATSRVLIQDSLYHRLVERLILAVDRIKIGHGMVDGVKLGPLVNKTQYEKVMGYIQHGLNSGIECLTGGKRPNGFEQGFFIEPTIFTDVPTDDKLWTDEIFGPVLALRRFSNEDEAIHLANDSQFGLAAAVMSSDLIRCERVSKRLHAGILWINCSQPTFCEAPWGGCKRSGIGRELGPWGLENYLSVKQVTTYNSSESWGWYLSGES